MGEKTSDGVALNIGNLAAIDKVDSHLGGYTDKVFGEIGGRMKDFFPLVKLMKYYKLGESLAITRLYSYPAELFYLMGRTFASTTCVN